MIYPNKRIDEKLTAFVRAFFPDKEVSLPEINWLEKEATRLKFIFIMQDVVTEGKG